MADLEGQDDRGATPAPPKDEPVSLKVEQQATTTTSSEVRFLFFFFLCWLGNCLAIAMKKTKKSSLAEIRQTSHYKGSIKHRIPILFW